MLRKTLLAVVAAATALTAVSAASAVAAPPLVGHWNFASGSGQELTGNWSSFQLIGDASISQGTGLVVDGTGNGANAATGWAVADGYSGPTIADKTLVASVRLDNTYITSGSPLSLYNPTNNDFDAIDYAEIAPYQWMAGSDFFRRTQSFVPGQIDNAGPDVTRQIAISYQGTGYGTETISGCLNGQSLGSYSTGNAEAFGTPVEALFGPRHEYNFGGGGPVGSIDAHILDSRVYAGAMSCSQVNALNLMVPTTKDQCKSGNFANYVDSNGTAFKNQGDCVSFVASGGKSPAAGTK